MKLHPVAPLATPGARTRIGGVFAYPSPCEDALRLRALRAEYGIPMFRAAQRLGITVSEVCDLEWGRAVPDDWAVLLLAVVTVSPVAAGEEL